MKNKFSIKYDKIKKQFYYIENGKRKIVSKTKVSKIIKSKKNKNTPYIELKGRSKFILHGVDVDDKRLQKLRKRKKRTIAKQVKNINDNKEHKVGVTGGWVEVKREEQLSKAIDKLNRENILNQALVPYVSNKKTEDPLSREVQEMKKEIEHYRSKKDSQPIVNVYNVPPELKDYLQKMEKPVYYDPERVKLIEEPPEPQEEPQEKVELTFEKVTIDKEDFILCPFCKKAIKVYKNTEFNKMKNHVNSAHIDLIDKAITTEYVREHIV